ncbi:hypothetical protein AOLI_G00050960 [Acnodon oligacanthus]
MSLPFWAPTSTNYEATSGLADNSLWMRAKKVRGFACVSEWLGKSSSVLDTEIINPLGVGSSFTLSMILVAAYQPAGAWKKSRGNKRQPEIHQR